MADSDQKDPTTVAPVAEESQAVKNLLSVLKTLGDSLSNADRAKFESLLERARAADAAQSK